MSARTIPRSTPRLTGRAALLLALVLLLAAALVVPLKQYFAQRSDIGELQGRVEYLQGERDELARYVESLRDPANLEQKARECYGFVKPGEIAFVTIPEDGTAPLRNC